MPSVCDQNMGKLVSVILPAYNVERFIEKCLDSVLNQTYPTIEIVVSYSESTDNTLSILESYGDFIKLLKFGKNSPAIARNAALVQADGEYISFCDGDDFFAPDKIEKQVALLEQNPDIGLVYTDFIVVDSSGKEITRVHLAEWDRQSWLSNKFDIPTSSVLLRRKILDYVAENGRYFDERLVACEDFDLLIRLANKTMFARVPFFLTYYTRHEGQLSKDMSKTIVMETKVLIKNRLYSRIIPMASLELSKMVLTKIIKNPMIGFGFFFKNRSVKDKR